MKDTAKAALILRHKFPESSQKAAKIYRATVHIPHSCTGVIRKKLEAMIAKKK